MITFEGSNYCAHCGEELDHFYDEITIRDNVIYHTDCLPENLKEGD